MQLGVPVRLIHYGGGHFGMKQDKVHWFCIPKDEVKDKKALAHLKKYNLQEIKWGYNNRYLTGAEIKYLGMHRTAFLKGESTSRFSKGRVERILNKNPVGPTQRNDFQLGGGGMRCLREERQKMLK